MDYDNIINKLEQLNWILQDDYTLVCYLPNDRVVFEINNSCFYIFCLEKKYAVRNEDIISWGKKKLDMEIDKKEEELFNIVINKFQNKFLGPYR